MDVIAKLALPEINEKLEAKGNVIIDGLYSFAEYVYLKNIFQEQLILIATHTEKKIRYERLSNRQIRPLKKEEVDKRDFLEITMIEKGGPIAIADFHILNNAETHHLYKEIDSLFRRKININYGNQLER